MILSRHRVSNYYLYDVCVESLFISEYMPQAPESYVKIFLAGLAGAQLGLDMSKEEMAAKAGVHVGTIDAAWAYWEAQGLARRSYPDTSDRSIYNVEFISLKEAAFGGTSAPAQPARISSLDDEALARLYRGVEEASGRLLEGKEAETIASWMADYSIDSELILFCYKYCAARGSSTRHNYVGKILKDWKAKGLNTTADVEDYLADMDRYYEMYRRIFRELGFSRKPTEPEKRIMRTWFDEMGFSMEKVLEACAKTTGISNPNVNYLNSVLVAWYREERGLDADGKRNWPAIVEALYAKDRENNRKRYKERRDEIFEKIPRIKALMEELRENTMKASKALLSGNSSLVEDFRERGSRLLKEKAALLQDAGYARDATDYIYTCKNCRDTGLTEDGSRCSCYGEKLKQAREQAEE